MDLPRLPILTGAQLIAKLEGHESDAVVVRLFNPGTIGGTPSDGVVSVQPGFDWDRGRTILYTQKLLTALSPAEVDAVVDSKKRAQSWHTHNILKAQDEKYEVLRQKTVQVALRIREMQDAKDTTPAQRAALQGIISLLG